MAQSDKKVQGFINFDSGEYSDALASRVDLQTFGSSARLISNFIPEVQGGLKKFYGTRHIAEVEDYHNYVMVPFNAKDLPLVLVFHDGAVSVIDGDEYYDLDLQESISDYSLLRWEQQNDIMYFVHPYKHPFSYGYKGRGKDGKVVITPITDNNVIQEPMFPIGWSGNYNKAVSVNKANNTKRNDGDIYGIKITATAGRDVQYLDLPYFVKGTSSGKLVLPRYSDYPGYDAYLKTNVGFPKRDYTEHANWTIGRTYITIKRIRQGASEDVYTSGNIGTVSERYAQVFDEMVVINGMGVDEQRVVTFRGKTVSAQQVVNAVSQYFPGAYLYNNKIAVPELPSGFQDGDVYQIVLTQEPSNSPNSMARKYTDQSNYQYWGTKIHIHKSDRKYSMSNGPTSCFVGNHFDGWVSFSDAVQLNSFAIFDDTNIVNRKIKFSLAELSKDDAAIRSWAKGMTVANNEIVQSSGHYYIAVLGNTGGTTGSIQPVHTRGLESDGAVMWQYIHSGYAYATITSVESETEMTAVIDNEWLPILKFGRDEYIFTSFQWSIWGYKQRYPSQVFFYKNRLGYFVNTDGYGSWLNLSATGNFRDFGEETYGQQLDTSAITLVMTGHQDNNINWILPGERLYCGSYSGEYNITGERTGVVTPTTIYSAPVSSVGGAPVPAIKFKELNLFVGKHRNEVYAITYDYTTDDYAPNNIGYMSNHLLSEEIERWNAIENEDRNIYFRTRTDKLRCINYVKEMKILGYYRQNLEGSLLDFATSSTGPESAMYLLVERDGKQNIEVVASDDPVYMLDVIETDSFPVPHHAGREVYVRYGENLSQFIKVALDAEGNTDKVPVSEHYQVGIPMLCELHTQPAFGQKVEGMQQQSISVYLRLNKSGAFQYGSSVDFDKYFDWNNWLNKQDYETDHNLYTGDLKLDLPLGYAISDNQGDGKYPNTTGVGINIKTDTPEPFNLLSIQEVYR